MTRIKFKLLAGLSLLVLALPARADEAPPEFQTLRQKLQTLQKHGRLLSLEFKQGHYLIELLSPQGLRLTYRLEPVSGRLTALSGQPPRKGLEGLIPLESLLQKLFGQTPVQLLEAELESEAGQAVYELKWLDQGRLYEARFDARTGRRLAED